MLNGKKVAYYTLGCKLNFSETSTISRQLEDIGFIKTNFDNKNIALFLGSVTRNIKVSLELSPVIFVPQIMFAGFFIKMEQILA